MDQPSGWTFKAVIEIGETCDIPECDDPVEAIFIMVDSTNPGIETAFRVCELHLAETWIDRRAVIAEQAQWN